MAFALSSLAVVAAVSFLPAAAAFFAAAVSAAALATALAAVLDGFAVWAGVGGASDRLAML